MDKNSKIYVAGHNGLVGSAIWNNLKSRGHQQSSIYLNQTKAKAYCSLGMYDDALRCIDFSIADEGDCYIGHKAAFRHDKAVILFGLNDRKCLELIDEAIEMQPNKNSIRDWLAEKEEWIKAFEKG